MTITITRARLAHGYSGYDHLLDDAPLNAMIGRSYADLDEAAAHAGRLIEGTQDRRCAPAPVRLTDETGAEWIRWPLAR